MPPSKVRTTTQQDDSRSDTSNIKDRSAIPTGYPRKGKGVSGQQNSNGSALKEVVLVSTESGEVVSPAQNTGIDWTNMPLNILDDYRIAHNIAAGPAFTTARNRALLTNAGIGRQSPTMVRRKEKRRVPREQLAMSVRRHFNGAAVNELDVVVELAYKIKHQNHAFRMRSAPCVKK